MEARSVEAVLFTHGIVTAETRKCMVVDNCNPVFFYFPRALDLASSFSLASELDRLIA